MLQKTSFLVAASLVLAANPDKPEMSPSIDRPRLTQGLMDHLPSVPSNVYSWGDANLLPKACYDFAIDHKLSPYDFYAQSVFYDDCDQGWHMCRHKDANPSWDDMVDRFGRVPVKMRDYIRHFIGTPDLKDGAVAFTYWSGDMVFEFYPGLDSMIHEISHSLDWHALSNYKSPFSDDNVWQSNYAKDSNTPTWYGRNSWMEDFAESGMVGVYNQVVPGGFGGMAGNWGQIYNQFHTYEAYFSDVIHPGGTCQNRFDNSGLITKDGKDPDAKSKMAVNSAVANYHYKNENVTTIVPRSEIIGQVAKTPRQ